MRVIVSGSRKITNPKALAAAIRDSGFDITTLLHGACPYGVDKLADEWAAQNGFTNKDGTLERYPAKWRVRGKLDRSAGFDRNMEMAENADALIAVWDQRSPGTKHMIEVAEAWGLKVHVHLTYWK